VKIFGIGVDVVEIERIAAAIEKSGERFVKRLFTEGEREYCEKQKVPAAHYAARFAAKEAISKSFGTGIGASLRWLDMDIIRLESGQPRLLLSGAGKQFAAEHGISDVMISLSHARTSAVSNAVAIME
jgi:holo-[acyl-carrier protein] synthase